MTWNDALELASAIHRDSSANGEYPAPIDVIEFTQTDEDKWSVKATVLGPNEELGEGSLTYRTDLSVEQGGYEGFLTWLEAYI